MSGTSVDAVDAVVARFDDSNRQAEILATHSVTPRADMRDALLRLSHADARLSLAEFGALDQAVGDWFAEAALGACERAGLTHRQITAIGSHGQTVWHAPEAERPFSLQIGSAARIAARTGCAVVADFRNADIACGGQGAPLVCALHAALFADSTRDRVVLNIGGIANITLLPAGAHTDVMQIAGFDTGPGNGLMDAWIARHHGQAYDADGAWAATGRLDRTLLDRLLAEPYFSRQPPKSTGKELFGLDWLDGHLSALDTAPAPADVQATLCELTARTIADSALHFSTGTPASLHVCGGGVYNRHLMSRLRDLMVCPVETTDALGVSPDWVEALAFAWLARQRVLRRPGNAPRVTGASRPAVLGGWHEPPANLDG